MLAAVQPVAAKARVARLLTHQLPDQLPAWDGPM